MLLRSSSWTVNPDWQLLQSSLYVWCLTQSVSNAFYATRWPSITNWMLNNSIIFRRILPRLAYIPSCSPSSPGLTFPNCYCMSIYACIYTYMNKYNLVSVNNVAFIYYNLKTKIWEKNGNTNPFKKKWGWWNGSVGKSTRLLFRRSGVQIPAITWWLTTIRNEIWLPLLECLKTATVYLHVIKK